MGKTTSTPTPGGSKSRSTMNRGVLDQGEESSTDELEISKDPHPRKKRRRRRKRKKKQGLVSSSSTPKAPTSSASFSLRNGHPGSDRQNGSRRNDGGNATDSSGSSSDDDVSRVAKDRDRTLSKGQKGVTGKSKPQETRGRVVPKSSGPPYRNEFSLTEDGYWKCNSCDYKLLYPKGYRFKAHIEEKCKGKREEKRSGGSDDDDEYTPQPARKKPRRYTDPVFQEFKFHLEGDNTGSWKCTYCAFSCKDRKSSVFTSHLYKMHKKELQILNGNKENQKVLSSSDSEDPDNREQKKSGNKDEGMKRSPNKSSSSSSTSSCRSSWSGTE